METKLNKGGRLVEYNLEMAKQIQRGGANGRDLKGLQNTNGSLIYVNPFAVFNHDSPSTKIGIISHSALKNIRTGLSSVNACMLDQTNLQICFKFW